MRDPFTDPYCRPEDLGLALPESDHAVSVCLPTWDDVIGYEEGEERVLDAMECGYPRFVAHPCVAELFLAAQEEYARTGESALVFPSLAAAWRCADYVKARTGLPCRLESYAWENLTVVLLPEEGFDRAWKAWQHGGEIVSSRLAESALTDAPLPDEVAQAGERARAAIRERIAESHGKAGPGDVFLFSSGMAAIAALHRIAVRRRPEAPTVQVEFPYLDSLKVQEQFHPAGAVDLSVAPSGGKDELSAWFGAGGEAAAVFGEVPSNPLLRSPDLAGIAPLLREREVPLFVDDTVATSWNVDVLRLADAATSSLTKTFSGAGDVAAGAVVVNPASPFAELLREELPAEEAAAPLFARDAIVLETNSRHVAERVDATDANALALFNCLREHPAVERVWHPVEQCRGFYDAVRKDGGGYGGLISLQLAGGEAAARRFYDALEISKGPSLGTNFSLACPYTLLAHYNELDWAAERGVPRDLVRIWAGIEEPDDLVERVERALDA